MKFKKSILAIGAVASVAAPVAAVVACSSNDSHKQGVIFTEYVRSHDTLLSLGVAPQFHARSDLGTTHGLTNEGYLVPFTDDTLTKNGKLYGDGDREYYSTLGIGAYFARHIDDAKGYFTDVTRKIDLMNSNDIEGDGTTIDLNWKPELTKVAGLLDKWTNTDAYSKKAKDILAKWDVREKKLIADDASQGSSKTVLLVEGVDDPTQMFDAVIATKRVSELYGLKNVEFPKIDSSFENTLKIGSWSIKGADDSTANTQLLAAFAGKVDEVIYLKTPASTVTEADVKARLAPLKKTGGEVLFRGYDNWLLPMNGAAIGANVAMDNIEKDIFKNTPDESWKTQFDKASLKNLIV